MFISDDEMFYTKTNDLTFDYSKKSDKLQTSKSPVCRFFIPKATCKANKIGNLTGVTTNEKQVYSIEITNIQVKNKEINQSLTKNTVNKSSATASSHESYNTDDDCLFIANISKPLSLVSKPMVTKSPPIDTITTKDSNRFFSTRPFPSTSNSFSSISSGTIRYKSNIIPDLYLIDEDDEEEADKVQKEHCHSSTVIDYYPHKKHTPTNILHKLKRSRPCSLPLSKSPTPHSHQSITSSPGPLLKDTTSTLKAENSIPESVQRDISPLSDCGSSTSSIRTLHVDLDRDPPHRSKSMQPIVINEKMQTNGLRKEVVPTTDDNVLIISSDENEKKNVGPKAKSKRRPLKRVIESDEDTESADYEKKRKVSVSSEDSVEISQPGQKSTLKDKIHCFVCKTNSELFCDKHPVLKILNVNIECPFVEYLTNKSHDKYFDPTIAAQKCCCKQNELDHIQQSLPHQFQLKESELFEIGVWTKVSIAQGTVIGPYLGEVIEQYKAEMLTVNRYKTRGTSRSSYFSPCIEFAFKSNWLRCINFTNSQSKSNVHIIHYDDKVFFQASKNIGQEKELLVINKIEVNVINEILINEDVLQANGKRTNVDYTVLSDEDLQMIPFNGYKYSKNMIIDIARIWREYPNMTIGETIELISLKYPSGYSMTRKYLSRITNKYGLRHRGGSLVGFDSEMKEFVRILLLKYPHMTANKVNEKLFQHFPLREQIENKRLNAIIKNQRLRPTNHESGIINEILTSGSHEENRTTLSRDVQLNLNRNFKRNDSALLESIREILKKDPFKYLEEITAELKKMFVDDVLLDVTAVRTLMKSNNISFNQRFCRKIDDDMKRLICKIRNENPNFSCAKINRCMRRMLPNKPFVESNAVYLVLRKFGLANTT